MSGQAKPWWKGVRRILQFNIEDRYGHYVAELDAEQIVETAKKIHADTIVFFARDAWGYTFYRGSRAGPPHPKMKGDLVRELIRRAHEEGIKVVLMTAHTANKLQYMLHSDWAQVNREGEVVLLEHAPPAGEYKPEWPELCINSPFADHLELEVWEASSLGADAVMLDSFRYLPDPSRACYCRWCRARFRSEKGYEMPSEPDWSDSRWRELWDWRYSVAADVIRRLKKASHGLPLVFNSHPAGWAGRMNRLVEEASDSIDIVFAECSEADHQPPGFIAEMVKLSRAVGRGKPVWATRNSFHFYMTTLSSTMLTVRQGLREAFIAGGSPMILVFSSLYMMDKRPLEAAAKVFQEIEVLEEYMDGAEPVRHVGIVFSTKSLDHYGRLTPSIYVDDVRGFYYALTSMHVPVEYTTLEALQECPGCYNVVVLPSTACMDDRAARIIRRLAEQGVGIIATWIASAMHPCGVECRELLLSDLLGVRLQGVLRLDWSYIILGEELARRVGRSLLPWGFISRDLGASPTTRMLSYHTLVESVDADVDAWLALPSTEHGYEYTAGRSPPSRPVRLDAPAILHRGLGRGASAVYFTGQLGRMYWHTGHPDYLSLISWALETASPRRPIVEVDAPPTLLVEPYRQGERLVVHMLNTSYNQRTPSMGLGGSRQPLPGFSSTFQAHPATGVVPVHNVRLRVMGTYSHAYMPLRGDRLEVKVSGSYTEVVVPLVDEYEVVVLEP